MITTNDLRHRSGKYYSFVVSDQQVENEDRRFYFWYFDRLWIGCSADSDDTRVFVRYRKDDLIFALGSSGAYPDVYPEMAVDITQRRHV